MFLKWLSKILVKYPYIVLISLTIIYGTCLILPLTYKKLPNFADPQMGFDTRGTILSDKFVTWKNLVESTKASGVFTLNPREYLEERDRSAAVVDREKERKRKKKKNRRNKKKNKWKNKLNRHFNKIEDDKLEKIENAKNRLFQTFQPEEPPFFCGPPNDEYSHVIVTSKTNQDLFSLGSLAAICSLENELTKLDNYSDLCIVTAQTPKHCCRPWSLPNYIAISQNKKSCLDITEEDVNKTKSVLIKCAEFYHDGKIHTDCGKIRGLCEVPEECVKYDLVFNILYYLTSSTFLPPNDTPSLFLDTSTIFLPMAQTTATLPYYHKLPSTHPTLSIAAMNFGIKEILFDRILLQDAKLMLVGAGFVVVCMWLYTASIFLTIMTTLAIAFSLGLSYFVYIFVLGIEFFPFMNLLAGIVAIGIGADDAFIFCKIWTAIRQTNEDLDKVTFETMRHSSVSMFVTSLTTSVAFLTSYLSSITAIRCFGVFAGTSVIANYLLMMTWLPAAVIIHEKLFACANPPWIKPLSTRLASLLELLQNAVITSVIRFRIVFFFGLTGLAVASSLVVFYYPKLRLSNSNEFQLFETKHPFEQYDLIYKNKFRFKNNLQHSPNFYTFPLRFVLGVDPIDDGDHLNPQSLGSLHPNPSFNMSDPEVQVFLLSFCKDLRKQPFFQPKMSLFSNCFLENFVEWMERPCEDLVRGRNREPCCEVSVFPYASEVFEDCVIEAMGDFGKTPKDFFDPGFSGPRFTKEAYPKIQAVVIEYDSNVPYTLSNEIVTNFVGTVEDWLEEMVTNTTILMFFTTETSYFDLQQTLSQSTLNSIKISILISSLILFLTTLNFPILIFGIFTIASSILTTIAILVLLGWTVNILESIAISSAIGLTIDFTLHFTVNYNLSPKKTRRTSTIYALENMLKPISMAGLTTGSAGLFMMPSQILAYRQIGEFLVIVMGVSWVFCVFHLGALLALLGPQNDFGQFYYSRLFGCRRKKNEGKEDKDDGASLYELEELKTGEN